MGKKQVGQYPEVVAIGAVISALESLNSEAQSRVLKYVSEMLNVEYVQSDKSQESRGGYSDMVSITTPEQQPLRDSENSGLEGISPVAVKWMSRNDLSPNQLSSIFSLGVDEIDLVAKKVPGDNTKERMHSVMLLIGVAAYLSSGVTRFSHQQFKETCLHYDAYDGSHFATYIKNFSSELSGAKETGYTLTARGLTNATELVKQLGKQ